MLVRGFSFYFLLPMFRLYWFLISNTLATFFNCIGFHHKHFGHITIRFGCLVLQPHWPHKMLIQSYFSKTFLFQTKTDFIPSVWGDMLTSVSSRWRKGCLQKWPASKGRMRLAPLYMDEGGDSLLVIDP